MDLELLLAAYLFALLKPMNMVQQFLTPVNIDERQDNFKERSSLMFQIIRKMQYEIHPSTQSKTKVLSVSSQYRFQKSNSGTTSTDLARNLSTWLG
ncbi:hypothetical protein TKK_0001484 [Trichogramma kaykai]|uniref:Uncharacterized protein n=1 Tax=Trichogramma kaykai TaxID=54128 RepID=A0ABD2X2E7_9HYME